MSDNDIPLTRPCFGPEEEAAVSDCLRSGWLTAGPRVSMFERAFADFVGAPGAVAVSSGTAALHLALWSLDLQPGDEVITPSLTWVSAPNVIALLGARPRFCDVDPETLCLDIEDAASLVNERTRAIVPVHFAGRTCDMAALHAFAVAHDIAIIEDAAHAIGSEYGGRRIGAHSGMCAFSFHPNKNITTGEGGMLTGLDEDRLAFARLHRYHGLTRDTFVRMRAEKLPHYDDKSPGLKYIMTDVAAAIGACQLEKLEGFNRSRAALAAAYRERLHPLADRVWFPADDTAPGRRHAWHLFTVCVADRPGLREAVMSGLKRRGIGFGLHYLPVHEMSWVRERAWGRPLPVAERLGRTLLSLPMYPALTEGDVARVVSALEGALDEALAE